MAMKVEIISKQTIKPSSPTPYHLRHFKICLLDELAPPSYVPILLLYSPPDGDSNSLSQRLKESLSKTLTHFYPFCGTLPRNGTVDCSDNGAIYVEARASVSVSGIVNNPETELISQLFPFDPYHRANSPDNGEEKAVTFGVQVNFFSCGGVGIGVCVSHKLADGATMASFLDAWSTITSCGVDETIVPPRLDSSSIFPPKGIDIIKQSDMIRNDKVITKRFEFDAKNLVKLKAKAANFGHNPTRVEAVTALIWKSAMEANRKNSGKQLLQPSIATHLVNIRSRTDPPLPENSVGNLWRLAVAPFKDAKENVGLHEFAGLLRGSIRKIDKDCVREIQGENGFAKAIEPLMEMRELALGGVGLEVYTFSSWTRFPLYEVDFGWGRPIRVCTITVPVRNCVILMGTKSGDGVEAWVTLTQNDMNEFQSNEELLQFVSATS